MNDLSQLILLPKPRVVRSERGSFRIQPEVAALLRSADLSMADSALRRSAATTIIPGLKAQGYRLRIAAAGIAIEAADEAGAFYGRMTLRQIARQCGRELPCGVIEDWPDFPVRGVMLDISRDKVPTMATLFAMVDEFAEWKINHLELYTEHTFAYKNHRLVWEHASPMTGAEIDRLQEYCRERFIELVPNQNSFGHFERWLKHPHYHELAESPDGFNFPWGGSSPWGSTLNPLEPKSIQLLDELYAELLPHFASKKFNVGCDETWELGMGRSQAECKRLGPGRVYLDFLLKIHKLVQKHGRTMHFWGDIILHHPELVQELPEDVVVLEWGYEADSKFDEHGALFAQSGRKFYVCPGTSSWGTIGGRTENCLGNLRNAAANGLKHGAAGFLNTDWGDLGHWQYLPVSYLGFAAGAALSWCYETNKAGDFIAALDTHVFCDEAGVMGRLASDLGNAYLHTGKLLGNSSALFWLIHKDTMDIPPHLAATRTFIDAAAAPLPKAKMQRADAVLIGEEFANTTRMLQHACDRGLGVAPATLAGQMREIVSEHRRLWLARNRPGGLDDSARVLEQRLKEYER